MYFEFSISPRFVYILSSPIWPGAPLPRSIPKLNVSESEGQRVFNRKLAIEHMNVSNRNKICIFQRKSYTLTPNYFLLDVFVSASTRMFNNMQLSKLNVARLCFEMFHFVTLIILTVGLGNNLAQGYEVALDKFHFLSNTYAYVCPELLLLECLWESEGWAPNDEN